MVTLKVDRFTYLSISLALLVLKGNSGSVRPKYIFCCKCLSDHCYPLLHDNIIMLLYNSMRLEVAKVHLQDETKCIDTRKVTI